MARLTLRMDLSTGSIGPGKIRLLELVGESGSISAAGREMKMSYRRAWMPISRINRCIRQPVVETQLRGMRGGGAVLTAHGHHVIARYRAIEPAAAKAGAGDLIALAAEEPRARATAARAKASTAARKSSSMPRRARA